MRKLLKNKEKNTYFYKNFIKKSHKKEILFMKEIEVVDEKMQIEAHENVMGFDHTELCFKTVFDLFNDCGVFVKVFSGLTSFNIKDKGQIGLKGLKYGFAQMKNGKVYPIVDLIISVKDLNSEFDSDFSFTLTPFNASLDNVTKSAGVYGLYDKELSQLWRTIMKGFYKNVYVDAFKKYCAEVRDLKEEQIAIKANREYLKIVAEYEQEINSI